MESDSNMLNSDPNSALITQNLILNASHALDNTKFNLKYFLDFSSLCEAVVLFDKLQIMESYGERQSLYLSNTLTNILTEHNIVNTFKPSFSNDEKLSFIDEIKLYTSKDARLENLEYILDYLEPFSDDYNYTMNSLANIKKIKESPGETITGWVEQNLVDPPSVSSTGSYMIRSFAYMHIAKINVIDYYPDFLRVPYVALLLDKMYNSLPKGLYERISKSLELDLEELNSYNKSMTFPIPPFTALVLNKAKSLDEVPFALLDLRSEFASFRKNIFKIDTFLKSSASINEKREFLKKKEYILEQASMDYSSRGIISFKEGLNFGVDILKQIMVPEDPKKSISLISQPIEWLRKLWLRRPIYPLFRVDDKVGKLSQPQYKELISKHWGTKVQDEELIKFRNYSDTVSSIFNKV